MNTTASTRRPPLVIIVDDEEWSARSLESVLSPQGYCVIRCRSARQVLDHVQTISPDALFLKADLADLGGADLCRALRASGYVSPATPIVLINKAPFRRAERLDGIGAGAWDLITLPFDASELLARLNVYVHAKLEVDTARELSLLDLASGLYSVRGLVRRVKEMSLDAHRHHTPIACVVIAPEDRIDASQGNIDERALSNRLSELMNTATRGSDSVGRLTPSEFAVLAPRTNSSGVLRLAERLKRTLEELQVANSPDQPLIRVRAGCYAIDEFEETACEPVEILVRATMALRRAQRDADAPPICLFEQAYSTS